MSLVKIKTSGDWSKTTKFLDKISRGEYINQILERYAEMGLEALKNATPVDTGKTRDSWYYKIDRNGYSSSITWINDNVIGYTPIVILIQYGHATKNGGFVEGRDFINPAIQPIFDEMAEKVWKEVTDA